MDPTTFQETPQLAVDEPVIPKVGYIISRLQDKQRMNLAERLDEWERVQPRFGECARFRVGNGGAAVHSEPDSRGDRVFVSVLFGRESELREMAGRWGCPRGEALE